MLALVICSVAFVSCSTVKHVNASTFLEIADEIDEMNTMSATSFIGTSSSRVYLERWRKALLFESEITVYWTSITELPDDVVFQLKAGRNPWGIVDSED